MKPRLLDLFCGAGGAAMGYSRAGFDVVGVDIKPQPNYPFWALRDDALEYLAAGIPDDIVAIHASPPCQAYSALGGGEQHPRLIEPTRALLKKTGMPFVIENVVGAPLTRSIVLCGSMFGLGVRRHRLFECSFPVMSPPCSHSMKGDYDIYEKGHWFKSPFARVYGTGGGKAKDQWPEAMGIDWMTSDELREAIPPAYTEHIGHYLLKELEARRKVAA